MFKVQRTRILKKQFAVYDSGTSVTLKQGMNWWTPSKVIITQSLKHLTLTVSVSILTLTVSVSTFLSNQETCQLFPLSICESQKFWFIHDLLDLLNNPTKFQLNWTRT